MQAGLKLIHLRSRQCGEMGMLKRNPILHMLVLALLQTYIAVSTAQKEVAINKRISYIDTSLNETITWQEATDHCMTLKKKLCVKKQLCVFSKVKNSEVPRLFVETNDRLKYVPVADFYNDWIFIGNSKIHTQCQSIIESEGPPSWKGKDCKDATKPMYRRFQTFCQAINGFYCCSRPNAERMTRYPVSVYVEMHQDTSGTYYSFSRKETTGSKTKGIPQKERDLGSTAVKKFTLMSGNVKGKFEDPIFFCSRKIAAKNNKQMELFLVSDKWCPGGWNLNFFLYGSLTDSPDFQMFSSHNIGEGRNLRSWISSGPASSSSSANFLFYGPKYDDGSHVELFDKLQNNSTDSFCGNKIPELSAMTGKITSPGGFLTSKKNCKWRIRGPSNSIVKIKIVEINMDAPTKSDHNLLEINNYIRGTSLRHNVNNNCKTEKLIIRGYGEFCGRKSPPEIVTIDNEVEITYSRIGIPRRKSIGSFTVVYEIILPPNGLTRISMRNQHSTWTTAIKKCSAIGKSLCSSDDVCSSSGKRPFYGIQKGDQWTPISDDFNDWLQIGRGNAGTCVKHNRLFGPPLWGLSNSDCDSSDRFISCPKRSYLYCCNSAGNVTQSEKLINVLIYTTNQNGIEFSKYIRREVDNASSFGDDKLRWTPSRWQKGVVSSFTFSHRYSLQFDQPVYFCQREVIPAIGRLKYAYAMLIHPCESKGWRFLYHLYGMSSRPATDGRKLAVGFYGKRPHHSRIGLTKFLDGYQSDQGYFIYTRGAVTNRRIDSEGEQENGGACIGNASVIFAPSSINSPGYPVSYEPRLNCKWIIKKPLDYKNDKLRITIQELDLENPVDTLTIREVFLPDTNKTVSVKTLTGFVSGMMLETEGSFELNFKTDVTISRKGFSIEAEVIKSYVDGRQCGGQFRRSGQVIRSPNYPLRYDSGVECKWQIEAPAYNYKIEIKFEMLDLKRDDKCSNNITILSNGFVKTICWNDGIDEPIVLNASAATINFISPNSTKTSLIGGKGFAFRIYFVEMRRKASYQCGVQTVPFAHYDEPATERIIGGTVAKKGNFPWMIHVHSKRTYCGGSLINNLWVLTASHCLFIYADPNGNHVLYDDFKDFELIAGRHERNVSTPEEQIRGMTAIAYQDGYAYRSVLVFTSRSFFISSYPVNDIIMVKMDRAMTFTPSIRPICLPTRDGYVGDTCYAAGWGATDRQGKKGELLEYYKIPILESSLCDSYTLMLNTMEDNMICAGYPSGGKGMCGGDSGGPLFCRGKYGKFYLKGILSWGVGCADPEAPDVFTRVYSYIDWIKDVIENKVPVSRQFGTTKRKKP